MQNHMEAKKHNEKIDNMINILKKQRCDKYKEKSKTS